MRKIEIPWPNAIVVAGDDALHLLTDWFSEEELATAAGFPREKRRREWLLSRMAVKQLARDLEICQSPLQCRIDRNVIVSVPGGPRFASLSHSGPYAAAAISDRPVGIDIQQVQPLAARAAHLFLSDHEIEVMQQCVLEQALLHFWCAKEAAWKARGGSTPTLKQVPLSLRDEDESGLQFEGVETRRFGDVIVALTNPIF